MIVNPYKGKFNAYKNRAFGSTLGALAVGAAKSYMYGQAKNVARKALNSAIRRARGKPQKKAKKAPKLKRGKGARMAKLSKQVRNLQVRTKQTQGELIYRSRESGRVTVNVNAQGASDFTGHTITTLEGVLANCKFFNPSVPGTLTTADLSSGTYYQEINFARSTTKLIARNNYQVPCRVSIYCFVVKEDTSISPKTAWNNGLTDISSLTNASPMVYPTDSQQLSDLYYIAVSQKKILNPGQEIELVYSPPGFMYDKSLSDSHNLSYQAKYCNHSWLVNVEGIMGHDTTQAEIGCLQGGVDVGVHRSFRVLYAAGANIKILAVSDSFNSFTNGGVVSSKPVSDNIGYSIA